MMHRSPVLANISMSTLWDADSLVSRRSSKIERLQAYAFRRNL